MCFAYYDDNCCLQWGFWIQHTAQTSNYPPANHHAIHLKNVLFPGHNHLLTTDAGDQTL